MQSPKDNTSPQDNRVPHFSTSLCLARFPRLNSQQRQDADYAAFPRSPHQRHFGGPAPNPLHATKESTTTNAPAHELGTHDQRTHLSKIHRPESSVAYTEPRTPTTGTPNSSSINAQAACKLWHRFCTSEGTIASDILSNNVRARLSKSPPDDDARICPRTPSNTGRPFSSAISTWGELK